MAENNTPSQEEINNDVPETVEQISVEAVEFEDEPLPFRHNRPKKVYAGMWGPLEIVAVGIASFLLLAAIALYLGFVIPENRQLENTRARRDSVEKDLSEAKRKFGDISNTETQVTKLIASAEDFESRYLQEESVGKTAIYQRLNGLMSAFGLVNSSGPDYTPIEISEDERRQGPNERTERGRSKFQSLFPGIYVTMTVEGSYVNLRRFLSEIENSNEFIVISTIELEPSEGENSGAAPNPPTVDSATVQPIKKSETGRTRGTVVSLRLELAAYFQRSNEQRLLTASHSEMDDSQGPESSQ
jgi:hypothetical protein